MRAIRVTLGFASSVSSIRSTPYKLKLQYHEISRDDGRKRVLREEKLRPFRRFLLSRHFSARTGYTFSAFPRRERKKRSQNLRRYKRNVTLQRWNARALRARRFSREKRALVCAEAALPKRRPVEIIHNNESHA